MRMSVNPQPPSRTMCDTLNIRLAHQKDGQQENAERREEESFAFLPEHAFHTEPVSGWVESGPQAQHSAAALSLSSAPESLFPFRLAQSFLLGAIIPRTSHCQTSFASPCGRFRWHIQCHFCSCQGFCCFGAGAPPRRSARRRQAILSIRSSQPTAT